MRAAIPKLQRRIEDLESLDVNTIQGRDDPRVVAIEQKIDDTLGQVFGTDTLEYKKYGDTASVNFMHGTPLHEVREGFSKGVARAVSCLQTIIDLINENLADSGESPRGRAIRAFSRHFGVADSRTSTSCT